MPWIRSYEDLPFSSCLSKPSLSIPPIVWVLQDEGLVSFNMQRYAFFHCTKIWRGRLSYFTNLQHTQTRGPIQSVFWRKDVTKTTQTTAIPKDPKTNKDHHKLFDLNLHPMAWPSVTPPHEFPYLMWVYRLENTGRFPIQNLIPPCLHSTNSSEPTQTLK